MTHWILFINFEEQFNWSHILNLLDTVILNMVFGLQ